MRLFHSRKIKEGEESQQIFEKKYHNLYIQSYFE